MAQDFRIPRFISSVLLRIEEVILIIGIIISSSFTHYEKIYAFILCVLSQLIIHNIKDDRKRIYIAIDFVFSYIVIICMGLVYRNIYVIFVGILLYLIKVINFCNKRLIICTSLIYTLSAIVVYYIRIPNEIFEINVFTTVFICVAIFLVAVLAIQIITQINLMAENANEQEESLDDLLHLVENKVEEAQFANKAKGQFLANMSHEIRTPINAVLGLDTMILRESKEANIRKYAQDIQGSGKSLLALINDILDSSKIDSGKMELVYGDYQLSSLINDIVNMIRPKANEKSLELIIDIDENIPSILHGDEVRIKQVIINLLTNAVKYTHEGSVTLQARAICKEEKALITYSVKDTGIGIKPEDISKLSEEFVRIEESRNKNIEGTGLGMNIVINLLKLMGSEIKVESVYGEGSEFFFTISQPIIDKKPIGNIAEKLMTYDDDEEYVVSFCIPDCKLLIVDDNLMNRNVFVQLLKDMECQIDEAESGYRCLEMIQNTKYDIIFMDHMMPGMDGEETLLRMKDMNNHPNISTPVIILTANAITGAKEEYLSKGFDEYLTKPIDANKLEAMIGEFIPAEKKKAAKKKESDSVTDKKADIDLPFIDGVEWQSALNKIKDEKFFMELLEGFVMTAPSDMEELTSMYESIVATNSEESYNIYRIKVHSMKTNVATLGAYHVAGLAKYLEYAARDKDISVINSLMSVFAREWKALRDSFIEKFAMESKTEENLLPISKDGLDMLLNMLETSMSEYDIERSDAIIDELSAYSYSDKEQELFEQVKLHVMNLNVEECNRVILEWRQLYAD